MDTAMGEKKHLNVYLAVSYVFNCYHISGGGRVGAWKVIESNLLLLIVHHENVPALPCLEKIETENYLFLRDWFFPSPNNSSSSLLQYVSSHILKKVSSMTLCTDWCLPLPLMVSSFFLSSPGAFPQPVKFTWRYTSCIIL